MDGIFTKLAKIRKLVEVVQKSERGFNYNYASITEILAKLSAGNNRFGVMLVPGFVPGTGSVEPYSYTKAKVTRDGKLLEERINEFIVRYEMVYTWIDLESGEKFEVPWLIAGSQQDPAQAIGSALTYGLRQFLTQFFQIAQPQDDPDHWRSAQKEASEQEDRKIAHEITNQVTDIINAHLVQKPEDREEAIRIVKKYAKENGKPSGNPNAIKDPAVASKLFEEVSACFGVL